MRTVQIKNQTDLYPLISFITFGFLEVCKVMKEDFNPLDFMFYLSNGIKDNSIGIWIQEEKSNYLGVCIAALGTDILFNKVVDVIMVYNHPTAKPRVVLNDYLIPWAKSNGASELRATDPLLTEVSDRRLRNFGFNKKAVLYERVI